MDNQTQNKIDGAIQNLRARELGDVKVFMVEDDQMIRELVVSKLTQHGCIPYSTGDGSEALALAEVYQPDVVILDLMLPGMTGEEILRRMKAKEDLKHIPVIVFSNKSEDGDRQKILELGASRYHIKAMTDLNELVSELKQLAS